MNKRVISGYGYPIKHVLRDGLTLKLKHGANYIDEHEWERAKTEKKRLRDQIEQGLITDEGYLADWLIKHFEEADTKTVNSLTPSGAKYIAKKAKKDVVTALAGKAERGGIKQAFRAGGK